MEPTSPVDRPGSWTSVWTFPSAELAAHAATPPPSDDVGAIGAEIARDALIATGALFVHVSSLDRTTGTLRTAASAGQHLAPVRAAIAAIQRVVPGWTVDGIRVRADVNELNRRVYYDGRTISASFGAVSEGVFARSLIALVGRLLGLRESLVCPMVVRNEVVGALSFHAAEGFDEPRRRGCEAFARQAALSLENARLLAELRVGTAELRRARQRSAATEERTRREIADRLTAPSRRACWSPGSGSARRASSSAPTPMRRSA